MNSLPSALVLGVTILVWMLVIFLGGLIVEYSIDRYRKR